MPLPPAIIPAKRRRHRKRRPVASSATPVEPLVLVSAEYDPGASGVTLVFDRPVETGGAIGTAFVLDAAADTGERYDASGGVALMGPATVQLFLEPIGAAVGTGITLSATAGNGIVAADDPEAAWAGVTDLNLPFP